MHIYVYLGAAGSVPHDPNVQQQRSIDVDDGTDEMEIEDRGQHKANDFSGDYIVEYSKSLLKNNFTPVIAPGIQVRKSQLHGVGVFCVATCLRKNTIITLYPEDIVFLEEGSFNCLEKPYVIHFDGNMHFDGADYGWKDHKHLGHLLNTCHPNLPYPFTTPSARYHLISKDGPRIVIKLSRDVHYGEEILVDYHWHISSARLPCITQNCRHCKIKLKFNMFTRL